MGFRNLGRPFDKHLDNEELNALVPSSPETGQELLGLFSGCLREAESHVESCWTAAGSCQNTGNS